MATHKHQERAFSCSVCWATITVVGPETKVDAALRRVDWERTGHTVTCRDCLARNPELREPEPDPDPGPGYREYDDTDRW